MLAIRVLGPDVFIAVTCAAAAARIEALASMTSNKKAGLASFDAVFEVGLKGADGSIQIESPGRSVAAEIVSVVWFENSKRVPALQAICCFPLVAAIICL